MLKKLGFVLLVLLFATASWGLGSKVVEITTTVDSLNISVGGTKQATIDSVNDDFFVFVGGKFFCFGMDPDVDGDEALVQLTVYDCHEKDEGSCRLFRWDSDDDGVKDTSILTGADDGQRLVCGAVPYYLYFDTTTAPTDGVPVFTIGAIATGL